MSCRKFRLSTNKHCKAMLQLDHTPEVRITDHKG